MTALAERSGNALASLMVIVTVAGCASATPERGEPLVAGSNSVAAAYQLTKEDLAFDCRKLTGRMRIRILQLKSAAGAPATSEIGRNMQSAATPVFGGSRRGVDPAAELSQDRAMLHAYNRRLAEKKCKTIDLDKELAAQAG